MEKLKDIIETQYEFARWFDKLLHNTPFDKLIDWYMRAYFVIEECIETTRCCDSRKSWKVWYTPVEEREVKEEIIDIFKFTLNWLIDLSTRETTKEEDVSKEVSEKILEKAFWKDFRDKDFIDLLEKASQQLKKERYVFPTKNLWVKEKNTLTICREIVSISSKVKSYSIDNLIDIWRDWVEAEIEKVFNNYYNSFMNILMLWLVWTCTDVNEESFSISESDFWVYFDSKSKKNIKRQVIWSEENIAHNKKEGE